MLQNFSQDTLNGIPMRSRAPERDPHLDAIMQQASKVDTILVPMRMVYSLIMTITKEFRPREDVNGREYLENMLRYVFDEKPEFSMTMGTSACRTMLREKGFEENTIMLIEHEVLALTIEIMGEYLHVLSLLGTHNYISGYYWAIDQWWTLRVSVVKQTI